MNPWHAPRLLNRVANTLFALSVLALLAAGAHWFAHRPWFALRAVAVEAAPGHSLRHSSETTFRTLGVQPLSGTFFTTDLEAARNRFESIPWVRHASVRRVWPNRLLVQIEEHRPFAAWGDGRLVNTLGELFAANAAEADEEGALPELSGPPGSTAEVIRRWRDLNEWLAPLELRPVALALSPRWAWTVRLDNGTTLLLGRDQGKPIAERVAQMVKVWPQVAQRLGATDTIDLRYPNGFALRSTLANTSVKASSAKNLSAAVAQRQR
ncbi:MAG: FtsQ-type POTRA domain-containing protein [Betaproteobacteria bacterium]|nr:FtsQ-type POTRA domain-containing protein [Betaproteobacteria bacterium]